MEASTSKEYGDFAKSLEDELMNYTTNYEETNVEAQHSDATECSSSFDGSDCGDEGVDTLADSEVLSVFCGGAESAPGFHGSGNLFTRRKKPSSQWRSFIHPLMWRCKWAELQIKKLEAQARKYDRKLEEYNMAQFENNARSEVLCRKKRRRTEATSDVAAYMSGHNLFSYHEHRRYIRKISHNVLKNPGTSIREEIKTDAELGNDEAGDCDKFLEDILRKIEVVQSRVHKMKHRVEELGVNLCSSADYLRSPSTPSHRMPVGNYIASQLLAEYNLGAALLPTHGEAAPQQTHPHPHSHAAYDYENEDEDDVLIDNHRVREELRYFEEVKIHSIKKPWVLKDGLGSTSRPEPQPQPQPRSTSNLTNAPKTKRRKTS